MQHLPILKICSCPCQAGPKPYFVYMTAAQNKFLRIYYARVKECLEAFDERQDTVQN